VHAPITAAFHKALLRMIFIAAAASRCHRWHALLGRGGGQCPVGLPMLSPFVSPVPPRGALCSSCLEPIPQEP
jgi:hypothetical protein